MAAFREHVSFSSLLGVGYAVTAHRFGVEWTHATLAGALCGVAGMLPDLDSASGKPIRELFGVTAAIVPMLFLRRLQGMELTSEATVLIALGLYFAIRFGAAWLLKKVTVHRGMFHSIPAALIAAEIALLAHDCAEEHGALVLAGGVLAGFLSHLILDEIYSVDFRGITIRLNKSAGTALKLYSPSIPATLFAWLLLCGLTCVVCIDQGLIGPRSLDFPNSPLLQTRHEPTHRHR